MSIVYIIPTYGKIFYTPKSNILKLLIFILQIFFHFCYVKHLC